MTLGDDENVLALIASARAEDLGAGDVTSSLLADPAAEAEFRLVAKQVGVFAGREIAPAVLSAYSSHLTIEWMASGFDGAVCNQIPAHLATVRGPIGSILSAERILLNFLQRISGVASLTRTFVEAVDGSDAKIYDTRKTTPGWRKLEKYAVRCGGGFNHREGLFDAVLIKDNHLAGGEPSQLAASVFEMLNRLDRERSPVDFVQVEADMLEQVEQLFKVVGVDLILLDNFTTKKLTQAVARRDACGLRGKVELEASGGITLSTVRAVAETGVDRISVGAITHSAPSLDLSLERV